MTDQTTIDTGGSEEAETIALAPEDAARALGWKPQEEFKGPSDKWTDAKTFLDRREDNVGLLRENVKRLERRLAENEKKVGRAERAGFERAMTMVLAKQRRAVESGDMEAFDAAEEERIRLTEKPQTGPPEDEEERREKFLEWRADNDWYGSNELLTDYADAQAGKMLKAKGGGFLDDADMANLAELVKDRFRSKYPNAFGLPDKDDVDPGEDDKPRRRGSPVAAAPQARGKGGQKTAADLDSRARQLGEQMVRQGLFKDLNEYAKELYNG